MNRVDNKVAIVTGGGSGIGEAACWLLAEAGARVVVTDINPDAAEATAAGVIDQGGEALAVQQDVTQESDWESLMKTTVEEYGRLDILVNNAGVSGAGLPNRMLTICGRG